MFIITQLSEYISFYHEYSKLNEEQFKQKSSLKGALLEKETVCIGYAMAFERCMDTLGVQSKIVLGEGSFKGKTKIKEWQGNHAWNVVKIRENWHNVDVSWLSSYKDNPDLEKSDVSKMTESNIIEHYILSDDDSFTDHYKLEDNGIISTKSLENRFEIYENVKRYKNVLEEYDSGKRNSILKINLETDNLKEKNRIDRTDKRIEKENLGEIAELE